MKNIIFKIGVFLVLICSIIAFGFLAKIIWDQYKELTQETETPATEEFVSKVNDTSEEISSTVEDIEIPQVLEGNLSELSEEDAKAMIVRGFAYPISKELPVEYAVEMNNLINLELEGSIG